MNYKKTTGLLLLPFFMATPFFFSGCGNEVITPYEVPLEVWGVFDDSSVFEKTNDSYAKANPQVSKISYKKISSDPKEFEKEIIDAFASGNGPDVFFFSNSWLKKHGNKTAPMPNGDVYLTKHKNEFVDVVHQDFFRENQVSALPLYCDTLALYYNKHALNQAGITSPPKTWEEVEKQTKALTKIDEFGNIIQSTIALGRSKAPGAVNRSSDILVLMMLQNGAVLNDLEEVDFSASTSNIEPGLNALDFYSQFSQANSEVYTWNNKMHYSEDAFADGEVAMIIGYPYKYDQLKKTAPKLDFEVAPVPQLNLENKINFANYWGLSVARNKEIPADAKYNNEERIAEAWKYISHITTKPTNGEEDITKTYLDLTNKIAARKDLLEEQKNEPFRGIFAEQALTARSWVVPDETAADEILTDAINEVASGEAPARDALSRAMARLNAIWK
jgi:ABC-type glycerol-3-phosphate transport system substrate-binding protein